MRKLLPCLFLLVAFSFAQEAAGPMAKGAWNFGLWAGGGNGVGERSDHQFLIGGFRAGRVMTEVHGEGWVRGNFEMALDVIPLYAVFAGEPFQRPVFCAPVDCPEERRPIGGIYYGASINPLVLRWNFVGRRKTVPFVEIAGGMLLTNRGFPDTATTHLNFTPQFAAGVQILRKPKQALVLSCRLMHVSNASTSAPNPGINAAVLFTIGYSWFK